MLNLHQLKLFCAVVEHGSFSKASQALFLSQPALSIQLRRLERSLGVSLFTRRRGTVALTEAGQLLYQTARSMLELQRATQARLDAIRTAQAGTLIIGVTATGALYFLLGALAAFRREVPGVQVELLVTLTEDLLEKVSLGAVDCGLEWSPIPRRDLRVVPLRQEPFRVVVAPDTPWAGLPAMPREEFERLPFIALHYGSGSPSYIEVALLNAGFRPNVQMRLPSIDAVKRTVEAGLAITILSATSIEREVRLGWLATTTLEGFSLVRELVLLLPVQRAPRSPLVSRFVDFLMRYGQDMPESETSQTHRVKRVDAHE